MKSAVIRNLRSRFTSLTGVEMTAASNRRYQYDGEARNLLVAALPLVVASDKEALGQVLVIEDSGAVLVPVIWRDNDYGYRELHSIYCACGHTFWEHEFDSGDPSVGMGPSVVCLAVAGEDGCEDCEDFEPILTTGSLSVFCPDCGVQTWNLTDVKHDRFCAIVEKVILCDRCGKRCPDSLDGLCGRCAMRQMEAEA